MGARAGQFARLLCVCWCSLGACSCVRESTERSGVVPISPSSQQKVLFVFGKKYSGHVYLVDCVERVCEAWRMRARVVEYGDLTRLSALPRMKVVLEAVHEMRPDAVVSLGLPVGGGKYLLAVKRERAQTLIVSLLPEEEVLPMQAGSDILVDFQVKEDSLEGVAEVSNTEAELQSLLRAACEIVRRRGVARRAHASPLQEFRGAFANVTDSLREQGVFSSDYAMECYVDPETGVRAYNHVLLSKRVETFRFVRSYGGSPGRSVHERDRM